MEIITGYVGKPHVTSEQDRDIHIGIVGNESYVLQTGKQMAAEISSNNEIKIRDGVLMHQGCAASIKKNTYDSVAIINGSQGMKRIDLIVARYERDKNTGIETIALKVLQGTPAESNPVVPGYTEGDIQAGDYIADMPMYKVTLDGINITKLEKMFQTVESNAILSKKVNELNSTLEWTEWYYLGENSLGVQLRYRYNASEVEIVYSGTLKALRITGGSYGYVFPALPTGLNPKFNIEHQIAACAGDNAGALVMQCYPNGDPNTFKVTSHKTLTTTAEYICGYIRYTRG